MSNPSPSAPPRAPTFPSFVADVPEVDDSDFVDDDDHVSNPRSTAPPSIPGGGSMSLSAPSHTVPVVPLPVSKRSSVIASVFLWRDTKLSGLLFGAAMFFFYLTLVRENSVLSILGLLFALYQLVIVGLRSAKHKFKLNLRFISERPPGDTPLFRQDTAARWANLLVEEGNDIKDILRDIIYCDAPQSTTACILVGMNVYFIGQFVSLLAVLFVLTLFLFTIPLAYERNKKQVDDTMARAANTLSTKATSCKRLAEDKTTQLLDKAPPAVRQLAQRAGMNPKLKHG